MITATVRYKLPSHIDYAACRAHFHKIAPGFRQTRGLISKHFIWSESGWAGGVYQWERLEDAKSFYGGAGAHGDRERDSMPPPSAVYAGGGPDATPSRDPAAFPSAGPRPRGRRLGGADAR